MTADRQRATVVVATRDRHHLLTQTLPSIVTAVKSTPGTELLVIEQGAPVSRPLVEELGGRYVADDEVGVSAPGTSASLTRELPSCCSRMTTASSLAPGSRRISMCLPTQSSPGPSASSVGLPRSGEGDATEIVGRRSGRSHPWDVGHSSNMAVRREALLDVGGFDERIGPGSGGVRAGEDADAIARLLANGATLATGTGDAVLHLPWRGDEETAAVLRSYEAGAGVWIGAALRLRRPGAASSARQRLRMLREQSEQLGSIGRARHVCAHGSRFFSGVFRGLRLDPWRPGRSAVR